MNAELYQDTRQKIHGAARAVTQGVTTTDLARGQALLAEACGALQAAAGVLHIALPPIPAAVATLDDLEVQGRALRRLAEHLSAELYAQCPPMLRRRARWRVALYLLAMAGLLIGSMAVGEFQRWHQPYGLLVTYYQDATLTRPGWSTYEMDLQSDPTEHPLPWWFGRGAFSSRWTGYLVVPREADYLFCAQSSGGLRFFLDGRCVLDNWRRQDVNASGTSAKLHLTAGLHPLLVEHYSHDRRGGLRVRWTGGGLPENALLAAPYLRKRP